MGKETITILETNLDDTNPLFFENLFARLFKEGALDVSLTLVLMKKQRPGYKLTVLAKKNVSKIIKVIFAETTSFGVRIREEKRVVLERKIKKIVTKYGKIRCKIGLLRGEIMSISPEYEDCKKIAEKLKVPLKVIYEEAKARAEDVFHSK